MSWAHLTGGRSAATAGLAEKYFSFSEEWKRGEEGEWAGEGSFRAHTLSRRFLSHLNIALDEHTARRGAHTGLSGGVKNSHVTWLSNEAGMNATLTARPAAMVVIPTKTPSFAVATSGHQNATSGRSGEEGAAIAY